MSNISFVIPEFAYPHLHFCAKIIYFHDGPLSQIRLKACGTGIHCKISSFNSFNLILRFLMDVGLISWDEEQTFLKPFYHSLVVSPNAFRRAIRAPLL